MTFTNNDSQLAELPRFEQAQQKPMSPKYRPTNIAVALVFGLIAALILSAVRFQPIAPLPEHIASFYGPLMGTNIALTLWTVLYHYFADPLKTYSLREQDLSYSSGLLFRKTTSQPMLRIQHIELKRGPIERMVGLASLQVFSAGGAMHTFEIPGLEVEEATTIRQFILEHKDLNRNG